MVTNINRFSKAFGESVPPPVTSYSIENDLAFRRAIEEAIEEVDDLRFAFGEVARDFFKSNQAVFSLKGSGKYPPLSPEYEERKQRILGTKKPILVYSGRLKNSLTGSPNGDSIVRIGRKALIMGTKVFYGIFHQSDSPRSKIPQRKFLFIDDARKVRWLRIITDDVARKMKARSG